MRPAPSRPFGIAAGALWLVVTAQAAPLLAQDAGVAAQPPETGEHAEPAALERRPELAELDKRARNVRALTKGELDIDVDPRSLFAVDLDNEQAVQVQAVRIRALLNEIDKPPAAPAPAAEPPAPRGKKKKQPEPEPAPPTVDELRVAIAALDPALWQARVELDRARLEFYSLSAERRSELLQEHAARKQSVVSLESERQRRAREAEQERQKALAAAAAARSEAERLVSEELARLITLEADVEAVRARFREARARLAARQDAVIGWQRRVRDAKSAIAADADATYDAVRRALRLSRDELSSALDVVSEGSSEVPSLGEDALASVPPEIPTEDVRERRASIAQAIRQAVAEETALREDRASSLLEEIDILNRERLSLLPYLSSDKRDAVTGFTIAGFDQAQSEARHLSLILRYHQHIASTWLSSLRSDGPSGASAWRTAAFAVPWLLFAMLFIWGRKRTPELLRMLDKRFTAIDRAERRTFPSPQLRAVHLIDKVHRQLEWVLFLLASLWLIPDSWQRLLEVEILVSIVGWVLGGALIVNAINAFAASEDRELVYHDVAADSLRLRSLRLVGTTIVVFALILVLSDRLVGQGTIYSWVFSTCWFAAIPVFLVLVRWWRGTVFARIERTRKKTPLELWVLSNRSGWKSFLAAMIGAVRLFGAGALKIGRRWLSSFDLARRVHAYLFKRELDRLGEGRKTSMMRPVNGHVLEALDPEHELKKWLSCPADEVLEALVSRVQRRRGGVFALIGSRGMGKSSLLSVLRERIANSASITCTSKTRLAELAAIAENSPALALLDDAHALIKPMIGGLEVFDEVIALARSHCRDSVWVLAIDASVWPLLHRARDARPMFDDTFELEPWNEAQIGALLAERDALAGITPSYDDLLDKLPPGADEIDRMEALKAKQAGYERMLWDHVRGNPALALEAWRTSLVENEAGAVFVRPLQVPDSTRLDLLPDSSLFILRAVLQLQPAAVEDVALATRVSREQVLNALRFGQTQGYLVEHDGQIRVTWPWLRAVVRLLERRHLLVNR